MSLKGRQIILGGYCTGCMLYWVYVVLGICCTGCMLYWVYAVLDVCCTGCMLYMVYVVLGVCCTRCMLYLVYAVLGVCCTWCMLYSVYAVLGVCWTWCMLYSVDAVLGVCCTGCQLMLMACRDWEGWLYFVFCDDGRVADKKWKDSGWKWVRCERYKQIWDVRGMTCLIGFGRPHIGVITHQIGNPAFHIREGKLTSTRNFVKSQFLISIWHISAHLSLSRPHFYCHLRTES